MKTGNALAVWVAIAALAAIGLFPGGTRSARAQSQQADKPALVKIVQTGGKSQLLVDGKPYFIRGAGGGGAKSLLAQCGGNSFRTWGIGADTQKDLDEAQRLGLTVAVGHWLGHQEHGFHYDDPAAVGKQFEDVRRAVLRYKNHPALLIWGLGNEMENHNDSPELWKAVEDLAKMVHAIDPNHPTMTVIAEIGKDKVQKIHRYCPDIDVIGVNTYGGGASLADRYRKAGGTKPFILTEYGPPGTWEINRTPYGAAPELTSTEKAQRYRATYLKSVLGAADLCLGSYAFTWGWKIEATATWFGMLLPDGSKLAAVDVMQELWSGERPAHPCPAIEKLALTSKDQVARGETVTATVATHDPQGDALGIEWALYREQANYEVEGLGAAATPSYPEAIQQNGQAQVSLKMPPDGGIYRLYCYVRNAHGGAAVGSLPIKVMGPAARFKAAAPKLPLVVVGEESKSPYAASGWMGDTKAIEMDPQCTDNPHRGKTCLKVSFTQAKGWGGVVWQHPANDWGAKPGGYDLSGSERLTFWARGQAGGERVTFGFGLIGLDKKYHDSGKAEIEVTLTKDWKQYSIDLSPYDLGCIKSGFRWVVAGQGRPLTFFLADVQYE
jgi:hypothetical protein